MKKMCKEARKRWKEETEKRNANLGKICPKCKMLEESGILLSTKITVKKATKKDAILETNTVSKSCLGESELERGYDNACLHATMAAMISFIKNNCKSNGLDFTEYLHKLVIATDEQVERNLWKKGDIVT